MSKNSAIFHKLPNGTYGLVKFYPDVAAAKKRKADEDAANGAQTVNDDEHATEALTDKGEQGIKE